MEASTRKGIFDGSVLILLFCSISLLMISDGESVCSPENAVCIEKRLMIDDWGDISLIPLSMRVSFLNSEIPNSVASMLMTRSTHSLYLRALYLIRSLYKINCSSSSKSIPCEKLAMLDNSLPYKTNDFRAIPEGIPLGETS